MMLRNFVDIALFVMPPLAATTASHLRRVEPINRWIKACKMLFCSTRAQVRHAAPVVFMEDFDGGEHVYRVLPINVNW
jgi:hypothetical protein